MRFGDAQVVPFISIESTDSRFVDSPATRDAIARRWERDANLIGGQRYNIDFAGEGTAEVYWDAFMAEARLLQLPDLLSGDWLNSGGWYDRGKGEWFNTEGAVGLPISILRDVVLGRIIELNLSKEVVDRYITRKGRTVAEEERFFSLSFEARMQALRSGEAL